MSSILKTDEIQSQNGGAVVKMQTLKHPSASGNSITLASDGSSTITNGTLSAGTLGSSVVFPSTSPYFTLFPNLQWESDYSGQTTWKTVGASAGPWQNKKASSQVIVELVIHFVINHNGAGGHIFNRYGWGSLFWHTSSVSGGTIATSGSDSSNLGTIIGTHLIGKNGNTSSSDAGHFYGYAIFCGDFTSGSVGTNHYFHLGSRSDYSNLRIRTWDNGSGNDYPVTLKVIEIP